MRESVASRGAAGSTFDHVARAAGVSRGLLHYYFGTKERLLVEVVRRECKVREALMDEAMAAARSADEVIAALLGVFESYLGDATAAELFFELLPLARRNPEIGAELEELARTTRAHLAGLLAAKRDAGVLELHAEPGVVAGFLFVLADGLLVRRLGEPGSDLGAVKGIAVAAARSLMS
jgi:AcrR family transcriptional regulator